MEFIDRMGAGREKTRGLFAKSVNAELPGPRAAVRTTDAKPVFYMYFASGANISEVGTISSPTQFSLLALEQKKNIRETMTSKVGWTTVSVGNDAEKASLFESQRVRAGMYKVTPNESMKLGEYAFIATTSMVGGSAQGVVIYDFGVDAR